MNKNLSKTIAVFLFLLVGGGAVFAQKNKKPSDTSNGLESGMMLLTIGSDSIPLSDFAVYYEKNTEEEHPTESSLRDVLKKFINYRLKVHEGQKQGLDTLPEIRYELESYKDQLAAPYLTDGGMLDSLTHEAYERLKKELSVSHILIKSALGAAPADTLKAYNLINDLYKRALKGEDFAQLAEKYSQDIAAKQNKGNIGRFTVFQTAYPFESIAYNTVPGKISEPFKTDQGYHILKVNDVRPNKGETKAAHILIAIRKGMTAQEVEALRKKAADIFKKVKDGEDWNTICKRFSDDLNTKRNQGELGWLEARDIPYPSLYNALYALNKPGEISEPVQTPFGFHILKLLDRRPVSSFEDNESLLQMHVLRDARSRKAETAMMARLKSEYGFTEYEGIKDALSSGNIEMQTPLFVFAGKPFTYEDYLLYTTQNGIKIEPTTPPAKYYPAFVKSTILRYETEKLSEKYPDFKMLVEEYKEGMMLSKLTEDNIWSKLEDNNTDLLNFYNKNRDRYRFGERTEAVVYMLSDKKSLKPLEEKMREEFYPVPYLKAPDILFNLGENQFRIKPDEQLALITDLASEDTTLMVQLDGYAGYKEAVGDHVNLSAKRLDKVISFFTENGIERKRLLINDRGVVKSTSADNEANEKNARVTINLYTKSKKALEKIINDVYPNTLKVIEKKFERGENNFVDRTDKKIGINATFENGTGMVWVIIKGTEAPRGMTFAEAKGRVAEDYGKELESRWEKSLRSKYGVKVNESLFKRFVRETLK